MMIVKAPIVYCDVDDTLVSWDYHFGTGYENKVEFVDPSDGKPIFLQVIPETVEALKRHALRGHSIIVWSAGGAEWAHEVVKKLGIESMVSACLDKPTWWYDDMPADHVLLSSSRRNLNGKPQTVWIQE